LLQNEPSQLFGLLLAQAGHGRHGRVAPAFCAAFKDAAAEPGYGLIIASVSCRDSTKGWSDQLLVHGVAAEASIGIQQVLHITHIGLFSHWNCWRLMVCRLCGKKVCGYARNNNESKATQQKDLCSSQHERFLKPLL
jgi:hypothetical protein